MADKEAAIRGLVEEAIVVLAVPHPAHPHEDGDLYLGACELRIDIIVTTFRHLLAGVVDNTAVQETARVLRGVAGDLPVSYPVAS